MVFQFGVEIHAPGSPVLGVPVRADRQQLVLEIHVGPPEFDRFLQRDSKRT